LFFAKNRASFAIDYEKEYYAVVGLEKKGIDYGTFWTEEVA